MEKYIIVKYAWILGFLIMLLPNCDEKKKDTSKPIVAAMAALQSSTSKSASTSATGTGTGDTTNLVEAVIPYLYSWNRDNGYCWMAVNGYCSCDLEIYIFGERIGVTWGKFYLTNPPIKTGCTFYNSGLVTSANGYDCTNISISLDVTAKPGYTIAGATTKTLTVLTKGQFHLDHNHTLSCPKL
jgi:hypothetical protein